MSKAQLEFMNSPSLLAQQLQSIHGLTAMQLIAAAHCYPQEQEQTVSSLCYPPPHLKILYILLGCGRPDPWELYSVLESAAAFHFMATCQDMS